MQSQRLPSLYSTQSQTDEGFLAWLSVLDGKEEVGPTVHKEEEGELEENQLRLCR